MNSRGKTRILVTNDDGIDSPFLWALVEELSVDFQPYVVAPSAEQSWISKSVSVRNTVEVTEIAERGECVWSVTGTPVDCVNIALGHLLKDQGMEAVVSGMNIGYNVSLSTILSSGTVAGALEGALWGLPAIAFSKSLDKEIYEQLQRDRSSLSSDLKDTLSHDGRNAVKFVKDALEFDKEGGKRFVVHNYNFPSCDANLEDVVVANIANNPSVSLFKSLEGDGKSFKFAYQSGKNIDLRTKTDLNCLNLGHISYSLIDYSRLTECSLLD